MWPWKMCIRDRGQGLMPDDAPQLPGGGADGLQQAIEADVVGDGDLEHIVNDEVAGEDDEQQHRADGDEGGGVHAAGQLGDVYKRQDVVSLRWIMAGAGGAILAAAAAVGTDHRMRAV